MVELPVLGPSPDTTPVTIRVRPETAVFTDAGAALSVELGISTPPKNTHPSPGSLQRTPCPSDSGESPLELEAPVESYVHQDAVNQLLFALWRGGQLNTTLTENQLGPVLDTFGGDDLILVVDPLLPPVVITSCEPSAPTEIQIGDAFAQLEFSLNGAPVTIDLYASFRIAISLTLVKGPNGTNTLGVEVIGVNEVGTEVVDTTGVIPNLDDLVETLLTEGVVEVFAKDLIAGLGAAYPIPVIDVGQLLPGVPVGTLVTVEPFEKQVVEGSILLNGTITAL